MLPKKIGRYEIKSELGRGGMATVYLARDPRIDREVAVKALPREFLHDPTFEARFQREAKTIAKLEHPAIVPIHDFGEDDGQPYLVMRYMKGGSLADKLEKGKVPLEEIVEIFSRIGPALDKAHAQEIIHRDLKPGNILFDEEGKAHLSDFGIAKTGQGTGQLTGDAIIGTPAYISPEQAKGDNELDGRSDLYALGVVLVEALTGALPYEGDTPLSILYKHLNDPVPDISALNPDLPAEIQGVIDKAMAKDREDRYLNAEEFTQALNAVVTITESQEKIRTETEEPVRTEVLPGKGIQSTERIGAESDKQKGRRWIWAVLGGGILMMCGFISVFATLNFFRNDQTASPEATLNPGANELPNQLSDTPTSIATLTSTSIEELRLKGTLAPNEVTINFLDEAEIILIPSGTFDMGITQSQAIFLLSLCNEQCPSDNFVESFPVHSVYLDSYWIYQTEVTNGQYQLCVNANSCKAPIKSASFTRNSYYGNSEYANYPVVFVDWNMADQYCNWVGGRLPTEAEWEKAARGTNDDRLFPWGNQIPNNSRANYGGFIGDTTVVGAYLQGASPYGVLDMAGNVYEWVNDWYSEDYYRQSADENPKGPNGPTNSEQLKSVRGGNWFWNSVYTTSAYHDYWEAQEYGSDVGFRCAVDFNE